MCFYLRQGPQILYCWRIALICVLVFSAVACGRKGPPVPPRTTAPPAIQSLNYTLQKATVRLFWPKPDPDVSGRQKTVSFRVYRSVRPATASPCPGCPIPFELAGEISLAGNSKDGFVEYFDSLDQGNVYYYKVVQVTKSGVAGDPSQIVEVKH